MTENNITTSLSTKEMWNLWADLYDRAMPGTVAHICMRTKAKQWFFEHYQKMLKLGPILETGCGSGIWTQEFYEEHGFIPPMTVNDISIDMLTLHKKRNPQNTFTQFESDTIAFLKSQPDNSFGGLIGTNSLIIQDPNDIQVALGEIHRVLVPGAPWWLSLVYKFRLVDMLSVQLDLSAPMIWPYPVNWVQILWKGFLQRKKLKDIIDFVKLTEEIKKNQENDDIFLTFEEWVSEFTKSPLTYEEASQYGGYERYMESGGNPLGPIFYGTNPE